MNQGHIVRSYDHELERLAAKLQAMGRAAGEQIRQAGSALQRRDPVLAEAVVRNDGRINDMQSEAEELAVQMLARRQPMAHDLRNIISGLKISSELERIADYAANMAKNIGELGSFELKAPVEMILQMASIAGDMLREILEAYVGLDEEKAAAVWHRDDDIDDLYAGLLGRLRQSMTEDVGEEKIKAYTALIMIARCCERIGDHITNVAENIYFIRSGKPYIDGEIAAR